MTVQRTFVQRRFVQHAFALFLGAAVMLSLATPGYASDRPNVLIMGEDADLESVPRDSRVFQRVIHAVQNQMFDLGFDVYDETAVTLDNFQQDRVRRTDQELIDIGRSVSKPPIDVVVIFSIYASMKDKEYTSKVRTRLEGRMIQVHSGKFLGHFDVRSPTAWNAPADCSRECVLEVVGEYSRILANDLGAVLGEKLAFMLESPDAGASSTARMIKDYNLIFDNFSVSEMLDIEEYLVIFSGYDAHRPVYTSARRAELFYRSAIESAKLLRNLNKMLEQLDMKARVSFSGNTYTIEQTVVDRSTPVVPQDDGW